MVDISVKIGKLKLKNPVMAGSGTFGEEYGELVDIRKLGAYVAKTITLVARTGNPPPRVAETAAGMLNSIGLENKGAEYFIKEVLPSIKRYKVPVIVSIAGDDAEDFVKLAKRIESADGIDAIELNLSCPNIRYGSRDHLIAQCEKATHEVVAKVRKVTKRALITKLSPNVTDIARIAKAAEDAGTDALTAANTFLGMAVDIRTRRPKLGNVMGGLSGPAIKPLSLRMVYQVYKAVGIPIIASGGIMNWEDAVEFILCGASAVQVGTANFTDPSAIVGIADGIGRYLKKNKMDDISKLIGAVKI